jgi:hypothetical protein
MKRKVCMKDGKVLVWMGALAVTAVFALGLAGCATRARRGRKRGGGRRGAEDAARAFEGFKAALAALGENTAESPAEVAFALDNVQDRLGDINAAVLDAGRYVALDLSGSTARDNRLAWELEAIKDNRFITGLVLPATLSRIDRWGVLGGPYLTSVVFPESLSVIGDSVFSGAAALASVVIPPSVASIGDEAFKGTPWEKEFLYKGAMPRNSSVVLREGTVSVAGSAFYGCEGLTSVTLPDSVTALDAWAFGKSGLSSVRFGKGLLSIASSAFARCKNLTSLTIPASVASIEGDAFYDCSSLTALAVEPGSAALSAEDGVLYDRDKTTLLWYPEGKSGSAFTIPKSVTALGNYKFTNAASYSKLSMVAVEGRSAGLSAEDGVLYNKEKTVIIWYPGARGDTSFVIPPTVKTILRNAFTASKNLRTITIPASVTAIESGAFRYTGLASVTFPASVTSIGNNAFSDAARLNSVTFAPGSRLDSGGFGDHVFQGGDLKTPYLAQGPGTYVCDPRARTWTKQ